MVLRCTARLLELLGERASTLLDAPASDDDWYANVVWLDRRKCLLLVHAGTLFPILVADVRKRDLRALGAYVVAAIATALDQEHLPRHALGELDADAVRLARTASRSVLGFMTEMALDCRYHVEAAGGLANADTEVLNQRLRRTLYNRDGYHQPLELLARQLQTP
jgi:hypothetical protein